MILESQICGLIIVSVLLFIFLGYKKMGTYAERLFLGYLVAVILCLASDILSYFLLRHFILPEIITYIMCKTFNVLLIILTYTTLIYILSETGSLKRNEKLMQINSAILILGITTVYVLPIKISDSLYMYGCSVICAYMLVFYFIIASYLVVTVRQNKLNSKKLTVVKFWFVLWTIISVIQYMMPYISIISFASVIGALIFFITFENPVARLDRKSGLFNLSAFEEYLHFLDINSKEYEILFIDINYHEKEHIRQIQHIIFSYFNKHKKGLCFKNIGDEYIYVMPKGKLDDYYKELRNNIEKELSGIGFKENYYPSYILVKDLKYFKDTSLLLKYIEEYKDIHLLDKRNNSYSLININDFSELLEFEKMKDTIKEAIKCDQIVINLQPIYSTHKNKFVSAEILSRIVKDNTVIMPSKFIPVAEKTGLILQIESIIFEKTCQFIKNNDLEKLGLEYLELNLSARKGESQRLLNEYNRIIYKYGINPRQLNLEITETASLNEKENLVNNMYKFINLGMSFSLDDFGSGESNLNYIIDMPVDIVKFDKDMIQSYFENDKAKIVMDYTIDMIHKLNLKIVAEGIETKEQLDTMKKLGIDYIQGYYFSKPLNDTEFINYITKHNI